MIQNIENYELIGYMEDDKVHINDNNKAYVWIKIINDPPYSSKYDAPFRDNVQVYIDAIEGFEDNKEDIQYARETRIQGFLKNKILIMQPSVSEDIYNGHTYYQGQNIHLMNMHDDFNGMDKFMSIPIFNNINLNNVKSIYDFDKLIKQRSYLCKLRNPWSNNDKDYPEGIIWQDDNGIYLYYDISEQNNDSNQGISFKMDSYKFIKLTSDWLKYQYTYKDIAYIQVDYIKDHVQDAVALNDEENIEKSSNDSDEFDYNTSKNAVNNDNSSNNIVDSKDNILFEFYQCITQKYNLTYKYSDIINFHNSIKSNLLTILTGLSGTGKSKIVTAYADALGIKNNPIQFNMVSVRPFWQDDSDLLGFVDTINNNYHPGDSGVVDTIIDANKNPNQMYIIVFDEMNLARVEYYFSQFLSVLEKNPKDRLLKLYNKKIQPRLYNGDKYPSSIRIPENIRFVGTMNVDETTFQISDKVLDRSNVITLKSVPFVERHINKNINYKNSTNNEIKYNEFEEEIHNNNYSFNQRELKFFDDLNYCIKRYLPNVGIGWRNLNSIEKFISNISFYEYDNFDVPKALDYQIAQRILPKIRGTRMMLDDLLNKEKNNDSGIFKVLDDYKDLSNFDLTRELLEQKLRESKVIGFAN